MRPVDAYIFGRMMGFVLIIWGLLKAAEWVIAQVNAFLDAYGFYLWYLLAAVIALGTVMAFRMIIGSWRVRAWRLYHEAP